VAGHGSESWLRRCARATQCIKTGADLIKKGIQVINANPFTRAAPLFPFFW